jgi:hypothetical protein
MSADAPLTGPETRQKQLKWEYDRRKGATLCNTRPVAVNRQEIRDAEIIFKKIHFTFVFSRF